MKNWFNKLSFALVQIGKENRKMCRRIMASVLTFCMVFSLIPVTAFATEPNCTHAHIADCYAAGAGIATGSGTKEPVNCAHVCGDDCTLNTPPEQPDCTCSTVDNGEVTHGTGCPLYEKPVQSEQTEAVKAVLALINALPTIDELGAVDTEGEGFAEYLAKLRLDTATARVAYDALTEEEKSTFDAQVLTTLVDMENNIDSITNLVAMLAQSAAISGMVTKEDGTPLVSGTVYLHDGETGAEKATTSTNTNGQYSFANVANGSYFLLVNMNDGIGHMAIDMEGDAITDANITLLTSTLPKENELFEVYGVGSNYDIHGKDGRAVIPTTYANKGYYTYLSTKENPLTADDAREIRVNGVPSPSEDKRIKVSSDFAFISDGKYLQVTYTLENLTKLEIPNVSLGVCTDVQIGDNDYASIYRTTTGFRMVNERTSGVGAGKQFSLACKDAAGVTSVDTLWFGYFNNNTDNLFQDTTIEELKGRDSGLAFSWRNRTLAPEETLVLSVLFSVNEIAAPPVLPDGDKPFKVYLSATSSKEIIVAAQVQDAVGLQDMLYYSVNRGDEHILSTATATGQPINLVGTIPAETFVEPGIYNVEIWVMNSKGAMSEAVTKVITVTADHNISVAGGFEEGPPPIQGSEVPSGGNVLTNPMTQEKLDNAFGSGNATLDDTTSPPTIHINNSITPDNSIEIETDVKIDLGGNTITGKPGESPFIVGDGDKVIIDGNGTIAGGDSTTGAGGNGITGGVGSDITIGEDVTVSGGNGTSGGDGINSGGTVTDNGKTEGGNGSMGNGGDGVDTSGGTGNIIIGGGGTANGGDSAGGNGSGGNGTNSGGHTTIDGDVAGGNGHGSGSGGNGATDTAGGNGNIIINGGGSAQGGNGGGAGGDGAQNNGGGSTTVSGDAIGGNGGGNSSGTGGAGGNGSTSTDSGGTTVSQGGSSTGGNGGSGATGGTGGNGAESGTIVIENGGKAEGGNGGSSSTSGGNGGNGTNTSGGTTVNGGANGGNGGNCNSNGSGGNGGNGANQDGGTVNGGGTAAGGNGGNGAGTGNGGTGGNGVGGGANAGSGLTTTDGNHGLKATTTVDDSKSGTTVTVPDKVTLADAVLTTDEKNDKTITEISVTLSIEKKNNQPDKAEVEKVLSSELADTIGAFFDITLDKIITNAGGVQPSVSVANASQEIEITITIPTDIQGGSNYVVIRVHNGIGAPLTTTQSGDNLTFKTDKFSTYAIAYTKTGGGTDPTPPSGGGSSSSGGSYTPPITVVPSDKINTPTTAETEIEAEVDANGNGVVNLPSDVVEAAIKKAVDETNKVGTAQHGIAVVINVNTGGKNANSMAVNLPKSTQEYIISHKVLQITLVMKKPAISMGLNLAAVTEINRQAQADVQLTATRLTSTTGMSAAAKAAIGTRPVFALSATYQDRTKAISDVGSGKVMVAIPYTLSENENQGNLYAVYADENGKVNYLTESGYHANSKAVIFAASHFRTYAVGYKVIELSDISGHWASNDMEFVANRGLLSGADAHALSPDTSMTRAMFVTALGRLAGIDSTQYNTSSFTDIKADAYYAPYVAWAVDQNMVSGITDTTFAPDLAITRQEMAVMMQHYAKAMNYTLPKTRELVTFADNGSIASWAAEAVKSMQMAGVIMGKDGNRFDPTSIATIAEVSAVLHRYTLLVIDKTTAQGLDVNDSGSIVYYENGKLFTGTKTIDGITYHFGEDGINTKIDVVLPDTKKYITHKIAKGDTLWDLSRKYKCTVAEIVDMNNIKDPDNVQVGTELKIPKK